MKKLTKLLKDGSEGLWECPHCHDYFDDFYVYSNHIEDCNGSDKVQNG